jgi:putative ABC transport system permease protein
MNLIKLALKNIKHQWLDTMLSVILLAFGLGTVSMLILVEKQTTEQFNKNIQDIDMVLGAKGSPLQLILANVYHVDAPTGNIKVGDARMVTENPTIERAIPLAYGDNFEQWRIVGTDQGYPDHYEMKLSQGQNFQSDYDACIGADVAKSTGLKLGDTFLSTHGLDQSESDEEHAHHHDYTVVGIYEPSGTVIDKLILTPVSTVWHAHEEGDEAIVSEKVTTDSAAIQAPAKPIMKKGPMMMLRPAKERKASPNDNKEVTAYLLKKRTPMAQMILPNLIKETNMQLALPAIEINRLSESFGLGMDTIKAIAFVIIALSFISIFISLFNALRKRKKEIAIMRTMGATRIKVFCLIQLEGLLLVIIGGALAWGLSRLGLSILSQQLNNNFHYTFNIKDGSLEELYLFGAAILAGMIACWIPAYQAYKMDISKTLSNE